MHHIAWSPRLQSPAKTPSANFLSEKPWEVHGTGLEPFRTADPGDRTGKLIAKAFAVALALEAISATLWGMQRPFEARNAHTPLSEKSAHAQSIIQL